MSAKIDARPRSTDNELLIGGGVPRSRPEARRRPSGVAAKPQAQTSSKRRAAVLERDAPDSDFRRPWAAVIERHGGAKAAANWVDALKHNAFAYQTMNLW
jgi:hypothetical protein